MAEENQRQGANPPQEQPNEALPRSYNQLLGTSNNPPKTSWPELVGVTAEEAKRKIKEEMAGAEIQVVPPGYFVTCDFRSQRVRLYVDESDKAETIHIFMCLGHCNNLDFQAETTTVRYASSKVACECSRLRSTRSC